MSKPSVAVDDTGSCPSTEEKMAANHSEPSGPDLAFGIALLFTMAVRRRIFVCHCEGRSDAAFPACDAPGFW